MDKALLIAEARRFLESRCSVAPVKGKLPWMSPEHNGEETWKKYQEHYISIPILERLIKDRRTSGLALVTGKRSQREVLDFDLKYGTCWYGRWKELVGSNADGLPIVETGGGGFGVGYGFETPDPRELLAFMETDDPDPDKRWKCLIETRGEGNLAVVPPSIHPDTKRAYRYQVGHYADAPMIGPDRRKLLWDAARSLNQKPPEQPKVLKQRTATTFQQIQGESVIAAFNRMEAIEWWLDLYSYVVKGTYAIHPQSKSKRKTVKLANNRSFHNASGDPLADGFWKTPFELMLRHDRYGRGDFRTALDHASIITGIPLMTWTIPAPFSTGEPPPPPPPPPIALPAATIVVLTDDEEGAQLLRGLGVPAIVTDRRGTHLAELRQSIGPYTKTIVAMGPPESGEGESLAADLGVFFADLPGSITDLITDSALGLIDLISALRAAKPPTFRRGRALVRRRR